MSDAREDVAKIVAKPLNLISDKFPWEKLGEGWKQDCLYIADKCIAAAEPHLRRNHRQELLDELIAEADARLEVEMRSWGGYAEGTDCDGWSFMSSVLTEARNKESKG